MANSVFANAIALDPNHVPENLQHRDGELDELRAALQPIADGLRPENAMLYGPSGTGKTTMAKRVVKSLAQSVLDFRWGYVDVMGSSSRRELLYELARDLNLGRDLPREGISTGRILDRIRDCDDDIVVIVDELQFLADRMVLGTLLDLPDVATIGITLQQDEWLVNLNPGIASRVRSATGVTLRPYGPDQLQDIVQHRVDVGLEPGVVGDGVVATISERASGDARLAIALLRRGARVVRSGDADQLTQDVIDRVEDEARDAMVERHRSQLGTNKRLLYEIICEAGDIRAEDLHREFDRRAADPPSRRQRQRYLDGLETYGLIEITGRTRDRRYLIP